MKRLWLTGLMCGLLFILSSVTEIAQGATLSVKLAWLAVTTNVNGTPITGVTYNAYRSGSTPTGTQDLATRVKVNSSPISALIYTDTVPLDTAKVYFYDVTAVSSAGIEGGKSSTAKVDPKDYLPNAPGGVTFQITVNVTIP